MRFPRIATVARFGFAALLLTGCASGVMSRINSNRKVYDTWPLEIREAVLGERAVPGMTPEQVTLALGKPTEVIDQHTKNGDSVLWIYRARDDSGTSGAIAMGGVAIAGGGGGGMGQPLHNVVFQDGVVVRAD